MDEEALQGKVAIVTGSGRGIGKAIATTLAGRGAKVVLAARGRDALESVRSEIASAGGQAWVRPTDISREADIVALLEETDRHFGQLDILVNNAAIVKVLSLRDTTTADWDEIMGVNARGTFILCREAVGYLARRERSHIVNICSVLAFKGYVDHGAYTASKHAVLGMSKTLAREVQDLGIRVHVINPGGVDTGMRFDADRSVLLRPQAIADAVVFVLSLEDNATVDEIYVRRDASTPWG